jgi:hypothetical protein
MATSTRTGDGTPETELQSFIGRFDAKGQKVFKSVRAALRKRFPSANELGYDYGRQVVIAYSPSERGIEGIVSIILSADGVRLYLMNGPELPDPKKILQGTGRQARYIEVSAAKDLDRPEVDALIAAAVGKAAVPLATQGKRSLYIKSGSGKSPRKRKKSAKAKTSGKPKAPARTRR